MTFRKKDAPPAAAAKASFSTATAYRIEQDPTLPSLKDRARGRRRPDPVVDLFESEVVPMLQAAPGLRAVAIFEEMMRRHPDLAPGVRRTLEHRIRGWRALDGAEQAVIFRQVQQPGRMGLSDFTDMADPRLRGGRFWTLRLSACRSITGSIIFAWPIAASSMPTACPREGGGHPRRRKAEGLQNALWTLGGAPREHRSDSLSAAFRNLDKNAAADLTRRYDALCAHYGMEPTRNNRGIAHENGAIESAHGHLKKAVADALLMRGVNDLDGLAAYRRFIDEIVSRKNARLTKRIEAERPVLRSLPGGRTRDYEKTIATVTSSSGFLLKKVFYTVPSRLVGHRLRVRLYDDRLDLFIGSTPLITLTRGRPGANGKHGALLSLVYRDQLFPRDAYRQIFDRLLDTIAEKPACRLMVDLLALAHDRGCEAELADIPTDDLAAGRLPDLPALRDRFAPDPTTLPEVVVHLAALTSYDTLLGTTLIGEAA